MSFMDTNEKLKPTRISKSTTKIFRSQLWEELFVIAEDAPKNWRRGGQIQETSTLNARGQVSWHDRLLSNSCQTVSLNRTYALQRSSHKILYFFGRFRVNRLSCWIFLIHDSMTPTRLAVPQTVVRNFWASIYQYNDLYQRVHIVDNHINWNNFYA